MPLRNAAVSEGDDPYRLLSIDRNAYQKEVRKGFREMALKTHPRRTRGGDWEAFAKICNAWEVLGNEDLKDKYDRYGYAGLGWDDGVTFTNPECVFKNFFAKYGGTDAAERILEQPGEISNEMKKAIDDVMPELHVGLDRNTKQRPYIYHTSAQPAAYHYQTPAVCIGTAKQKYLDEFRQKRPAAAHRNVVQPVPAVAMMMSEVSSKEAALTKYREQYGETPMRRGSNLAALRREQSGDDALRARWLETYRSKRSSLSVMASSPDHAYRYDVESCNSEEARQTPSKRSFYRWLMSWVESPEDDPSMRARKGILFPMIVIIFVASVMIASHSLVTINWYNALFMSGMRAILSLCFLIYIIHTKTCPVGVAEFFIISIGMTLFLFGDLLVYGKLDAWTGAVLIMDVLLLTCCRDTTALITCGVILFYVALKTVEEGFRFGLYDIVPSSYDPDSYPREAQGSYWFSLVFPMRLFVFYADFVMTRNFAHGMRSEQQKSEEDVNMANRVAASLVKFDLDAAEHHLLRGQKGGSSELQEAFLSLIANLKLYKPYLPDALFSHLSDSTSDLHDMEGDCIFKHFPVRQNPPGMGGEGSVTIAFTDIQSSTDIWEKHTTAMRTAMDLHNQAMRECIYRTNGYEVKTIGDAFMVAFDAVEDAVRFSLMAQEELVAQPWPSSLLEHPLCKACGGAWKGLRVRIGVHTGPARLEVNPTTGRTDYMGPTVNKTARVEAVSVGGAVAVTEEVLEKLEQVGGLQDVGNPATLKIGHQLLKGVGSVPIVLLVPTKLKQRVGDLEKAVEKRKHVNLRSSNESNNSQATLRRQQGATPQHGKGITKNKLTQAVGTMGTTRIEFSEILKVGSVVDAVGEVLGVVLDGVNRTDGVVTALCSGTVLVGWNTSKKCVMHAAQSGKFALNVYGALEGSGWAGQVTVGLCGGRVLHGMMGNTKQRFMTTIGGCVEVSRALADAAVGFGTTCLLAGSAAEAAAAGDGSGRRSSTAGAVLDTSLQVHTRPIDTWDGMTVYQLNLQTFALVQGVWNIFDGPVPDSWSPLYKDAFASRNIAALKTLSEKDPSLLKVVAILQGDLSLPRPFTTQKIDTLLTTPDGWAVKDIGNELSLSLSGGYELPDATRRYSAAASPGRYSEAPSPF